jgi:hypothetical protein
MVSPVPQAHCQFQIVRDYLRLEGTRRSRVGVVGNDLFERVESVRLPLAGKDFHLLAAFRLATEGRNCGGHHAAEGSGRVEL